MLRHDGSRYRAAKEMQFWSSIIGMSGIDRYGHRYDVYVTLGDVVSCVAPLFLALVLAVVW